MSVAANVYAPYDSGAGANCTEDTFRKFAHLWFPSSCIKGQLNELRPFGDSSGMQVKVDTGAAWVRGAYGEWTSGTSILSIPTVAGIPGGQSRIDRLVCRNDFVNNQMLLDVLAGTPGASPSAPALTQSSSMWELLVGDIGPLTNATTTISAALAVDKRLMGAEGGVVMLPTQTPSGVTAFTVQVPPSSGYNHLTIRYRCRDSSAGAVASAGTIQFNADAGARYNWTRSITQAGGAYVNTFANGASLIPAFVAAGGGQAASVWAHGKIEIERLADATEQHVRARASYNEAAGATTWEVSGDWIGVAAAPITSITFAIGAGNFAAGSTFDFELHA